MLVGPLVVKFFYVEELSQEFGKKSPLPPPCDFNS